MIIANEIDMGEGVKMEKKLLNYKELEAAIIGMNEKEMQDYVDKNAIWSSTRLLFDQTKYGLSFPKVDK